MINEINQMTIISEIPLINCESYLILTWPKSYYISNCTGTDTFKKTETHIFYLILNLSIKDSWGLTK